jgi:MtN3 and saliva related transmembrane protein
MQTGLHHLHKRKRISQTGQEPFPSRSRWKYLLDKSAYFIGIVGPVMTIPQLLKVWIEQNAAGVSLISWVAYLFTALFWLTYAITHKEKPLIFMYSLWILVKIPLIIGIIIYG